MSPKDTALIVVDMQNAYASPEGYLDKAGFDIGGAAAVIGQIGQACEAARAAGVQVVYFQNGWDPAYVEAGGEGSPNWWKSNALKTMREKPELEGQLLAKGGWVRGQSWAREVTVPPDFDFSLSETARETPDEWAEKGVRRADGLPWSAADRTAEAQLIAPTGASGPVFLLFPNHFAIRKYNNSLAYALGVGLLADRFAGVDGLVRPWPQETPLSLLDRMTAQRALTTLGFSPGAPDGVVGLGTRAALRAWQKANGLTADGYLSKDMIQRLKAAAGPGAPG